MPARPAKLRAGADVFADFPAFEMAVLGFATVVVAVTRIPLFLEDNFGTPTTGANRAGGAGGAGGAVNILGTGLEVSKRLVGTRAAV